MPNRRDFLKTVGCATGGMYLMGRGLGAAAQSSRKEILVGGRRVRTVDIHAHCLFREVSELVEGTNLSGREFPVYLTDDLFMNPQRIDAMDARGIDIAALSINRYWWYEADRELARRIVQIHDERLAEWCNTHPDRFVALTSVALQYPELAAEQLEYAVNELGHRGASVSGTVLGEAPSLPKYDPFWAKAEELGAPVFMHPNGEDAYLFREGGLGGRGGQGPLIANPLETTVFLTNMIFDGTLDRFPGLKVCGAHGGGYLPSYLGRTEVTCARANANCLNRKQPSEYMREQILADSMVFSAEGLRHLVAEMGTSQIVYGSDQPFAWPDTMDLIVDADFLSDAEKEAMLGGNLRRLLRIVP